MKQRFNRIFSALLATVLCVGLLSVVPMRVSAAEKSGVCGENLTWSFSDGRLTITGSGNMTNYNQVDMPPWYSFRENIYYLSLPEGLTAIGDMAFYDCYNLTAVTIPSTVKQIGKLAFCQCRNISILNLNTGLVSIGRSAFEQCWGLRDLRIPDTVTTIGYHAFYDCEQLRYLTIPASVTEMDAGVFAYCKNLVHADVAATLDTVPTWTFYGCENLTSVVLQQNITDAQDNAFAGCEKLKTVYYAGSEADAEQLREQIAEDEAAFDKSGEISSDVPETSVTTGSVVVDESGQITASSTTVSQTQDSTVSTTVTTTVTDTEGKLETTVEIGATIVTENGWGELIDVIETNQDQKKENPIDVNVYVPDSSGVPKEVINTAVNNSNVSITVHTGEGSQFAVSGEVLESVPEVEQVYFSYSATRLITPDYEELNGKAAYGLTFSHSSDVRMEILIRLPTEYAKNVASLYQLNGKKLMLLQNVIVDSSGYAHFYLANIDKEQVYRIGIDIPNVAPETVIVPEEYYSEYGITANYPDFTQYAITGPKSSWGLSMKQVTMIMMVVMVGCAVCIGVFMYLRNMYKLKKGYIPDIGDDDDA